MSVYTGEPDIPGLSPMTRNGHWAENLVKSIESSPD
jgi:hypothetical protein